MTRQRYLVFGFFMTVMFGVSAVYASSMKDIFSSGEGFANGALSKSKGNIHSLNLHDVPGYQTSNPTETKYKVSNIDTIAKAANQQSPYGQFVDSSSQNRQHMTIKDSDTIVTHAKDALKNASKTANSSGSFCVGANCTDTSYKASPDFDQAMSALSAIASASKDLNKHQKCHWVWHLFPLPPHRERVCDKIFYRIFDGQAMSCRDVMLGYSNCCQDKGWGHDIGLAGCHSSEKKLGLKKESGVCHYVGRYCSHKVKVGPIHKCTVHSKSYCCFDSKLGRIIQEGGRKQLHMSFGDKKHPNCEGFTPDQLGHIDFSKIDFSEFYKDLENKEHDPDVPNTQGHISDEVQQDINHGKPM